MEQIDASVVKRAVSSATFDGNIPLFMVCHDESFAPWCVVHWITLCISDFLPIGSILCQKLWYGPCATGLPGNIWMPGSLAPVISIVVWSLDWIWHFTCLPAILMPLLVLLISYVVVLELPELGKLIFRHVKRVLFVKTQSRKTQRLDRLNSTLGDFRIKLGRHRRVTKSWFIHWNSSVLHTHIQHD